MEGPSKNELTTTPSIDSLVKLLDQEIEQARADRVQPGWTVWAIAGALLSTAYVASKDVESQVLRLDSVLLTAVFASLLYYCLTGVLSWVSPRIVTNFPRRARSALNASGHVHDFVSALIALFQLAIWIHLSYLLPPVAGIAGVVFFSGLVVAYSYFYLRPYIQGSHPSLLLSNFLVLTYYVAAPMALIPLIKPMIFGVLLPVPAEWRVGTLLVVMLFLIRLLAVRQHEYPLIDTLVQIRRDLVLGRTDPISAHRHIEIVLLGLDAADVFEKEVSHVVGKMREAIASIDKKLDLYDGIESLLALPPPSLSKEQRQQLAQNIEYIVRGGDNISEPLHEAGDYLANTLTPHLRIVERYSPKDPGVRALMTAIESGMDDVRTKVDDMKEKFDHVMKWLKENPGVIASEGRALRKALGEA